MAASCPLGMDVGFGGEEKCFAPLTLLLLGDRLVRGCDGVWAAGSLPLEGLMSAFPLRFEDGRFGEAFTAAGWGRGLSVETFSSCCERAETRGEFVVPAIAVPVIRR